jgi:hypothetical protein
MGEDISGGTMRARFAKKAAPIGGVAALLVCAVVPAIGQTFQTNLLLNPEFTSPPDPGVNSDYEMTDWTLLLDAERGGFHPTPDNGMWSIWLKTFENYDIPGPQGGANQDVTGIVAGTNYTLSEYVFGETGFPSSASTIELQMIWEDSGGNPIGTAVDTQIGSNGLAALNTWEPYTETGTAPTGATQVLVQYDWLGGAVVSGESQSVFISQTDLSGLGQPPPANAWSATGFGDWNSGVNWSNGNAPNGAGQEADLFGAINSNSTIVIDSSNGFTGDTVGILHINDSNIYAIAGTGNLTIQGAAGTAGLIQVDQSEAEIELPLIIAGPTTFNIAGGATLLLANTVNVSAGASVTQTGNGTVTYQSLVTLGTGSSLSMGNATIGTALSLGSSAKVALAPSSTPYTVQFENLSLGSSASMDLTTNKFVVNYSADGGASPAASIQSYLAAGFKSGWNGAGIYSSTVASLNASQSALIYSIGYADGSDGITTVPSGEVEIMPTLAGDAKMQGNVVFGDFQLLSQYFGKTGTSWDEGNFTYGSTTNFGDFQLLSQNFGQSASTGLTSGELASINGFAAQFGEEAVATPGGFQMVSVPEPASIGLIALGGLGVLRRRRNRR